MYTELPKSNPLLAVNVYTNMTKANRLQESLTMATIFSVLVSVCVCVALNLGQPAKQPGKVST